MDLGTLDVSSSGEIFSTTFSMADVTVAVSAEEAAAGEMRPETTTKIVELFREHGVVLLGGKIIDDEALDTIGARMDFNLAMKLAEEGDVMSTNLTGNYRDQGKPTGVGQDFEVRPACPPPPTLVQRTH